MHTQKCFLQSEVIRQISQIFLKPLYFFIPHIGDLTTQVHHPSPTFYLPAVDQVEKLL